MWRLAPSRAVCLSTFHSACRYSLHTHLINRTPVMTCLCCFLRICYLLQICMYLQNNVATYVIIIFVHSVYIIYVKLTRSLWLVSSLRQTPCHVPLLVRTLISRCLVYPLTAKSRHTKWNHAVRFSLCLIFLFSVFCGEIVILCPGVRNVLAEHILLVLKCT